MKSTSLVQWSIVAAVSCAGLLLFSTREASAHARVVRSSPAGKAELTNSPTVVEIWFNELLDESFNSITVFPATELDAKKRTNLARGKAVVDAKDRTRLSIELQPLQPGEYVVEWRVLSRDGHSAPGRFTFRVNPGK
jgi:methionine-rich copper-binding protein CopC